MAAPVDASTFDVGKIRADFPILAHEVYPGIPLTYLDSAATTQKPHQVIEAIQRFYSTGNANIHRGIHRLAESATEMYEDSRRKAASFIGANSWREIVFTRNTTESINLVAYSWARSNLNHGDAILLTEMEHHSNLVPWQILGDEMGLDLLFIPVSEEGILNLEAYRKLLIREPKLVGLAHMSNMLGTINPIAEIAQLAHQAGAVVLVDGAQSVPHFPVDVASLGIDFLAFSAHKMCGPTGIGVLYGRQALLEAMPPFLGGGDMIRRVELQSYKANQIPYKFEAGTPPIAQVIGLGAAMDYLEAVGMESIHKYEQFLVAYALERFAEMPGTRTFGPSAEKKGGVVSFTMEGVHPHDVAQVLDSLGIAVRAGHHCAMPIHERFGIPASTRASLYLYNTIEEIDRLVEGLYRVRGIFI